MKPRVAFLVLPVLALAWMLLVPEPSFAQLRRVNRGAYYDGYSGPYYGDASGSYGPRLGLFARMRGYRYAQPYVSSPAMTGDSSAASYRSFYPASIPGATADTALIQVRVPPEAKVSFDDNPTTQTGPQRAFLTPPLKNNQNSYVVVARWMENGQERRETRTVRPMPGQEVIVNFLAPAITQQRSNQDR